MATVGALYKTVTDLAIDKSSQLLVEILNQKNAPFEDGNWVPCNDGTGHKSNIRTGLPTGTWRALYQGIQPTRGTIAEVRDSCGNFEDYAMVDELAYQLAGDDRDTWRMQEDSAHVEGMSQTIASTIMYGNVTTSPEKFHGIMPRYNALSGVNTSENVVSALGAGADNTSILAIGWGPNATHFIYPKGTVAGIKAEDLGRVTHVKSDGSMYEARRSHYGITMGLAVRDWRTNGRICNIDVSDHASNVAFQKLLVTYLIQLTERLEEPTGGGQTILYCNKKIMSALRQGIVEKVSNNLTFDTVAGKRVMAFDGYPVRCCDALINTEAAVT